MNTFCGYPMGNLNLIDSSNSPTLTLSAASSNFSNDVASPVANKTISGSGPSLPYISWTYFRFL